MSILKSAELHCPSVFGDPDIRLLFFYNGPQLHGMRQFSAVTPLNASFTKFNISFIGIEVVFLSTTLFFI